MSFEFSAKFTRISKILGAAAQTNFDWQGLFFLYISECLSFNSTSNFNNRNLLKEVVVVIIEHPSTEEQCGTLQQITNILNEEIR